MSDLSEFVKGSNLRLERPDRKIQNTSSDQTQVGYFLPPKAKSTNKKIVTILRRLCTNTWQWHGEKGAKTLREK